MPSAAELKAELRALRKEKTKPVSRMKVSDVSAEIERLKGMRAETPAPAATPSSKPKKMAPTVESVKEAKKMEFPTAPEDNPVAKKKMAKASGKSSAPVDVVAAAKKKSPSSQSS